MQGMDPYTSLRVSDADRHQATEVLQVAYSQGRIDEVELDQRLSTAMQAKTRSELATSVRGLPALHRMASAPAPTQGINPNASAAGGLAHLSGLVSWVVGPLLFYAAAPVGSPARREAADAFNFQVVALPLYIVMIVLGNAVLPDALVGALAVLGWFGWLLLTIVGSARAFGGQPWRNPLLAVMPWKPLDPGGR